MFYEYNKILNYTINKYAILFPDADVISVASRYSRKNVLVEFNIL